MHEKIAQRNQTDLLGFWVNQPSFNQTPDCGMHFRGAHSQCFAHARIAGMIGTQCEFERNYNVLWLGNHINTVFANSE